MNKAGERGEDAFTETTRILEGLLAQPDSNTYVLKLYITGMTARSLSAIENIRVICEQHLKGRYSLEIIDIYQHPTLAEGEQILATPTLLKKLPKPLRRIVGDLSNTERVLLGLDLQELS